MNKIVDDILELLEENELVQNTRVVNYDETPSGRLEAKLRSQLPKSHTLQIWIHIEPKSLDYAYQLFTTVPLLRWDNSPHYATEIFPTPRITSTTKTATYPNLR